MYKRIFILTFSLFTFFSGLNAQQYLVDYVTAVVGNNAILLSEIEQQYNQLISQRYKSDGDIKCEVFEELLVQKLLLSQASVDSIEVTDNEVDSQLESRMKYMLEQLGSKEKLEEYFKKSSLELKEDFRKIIRNLAIGNKMRREITKNIKITPTEVTDYYNTIHQDSLPMVESSLEISQITLYAGYTDKSIFAIKEKLLEIRKQILEGRSFAALARLYSVDVASAREGGEIGYLSKGELDPEYAKVAFGLRPGSVSTIVETQFGYHLIQLIDKKDDKANTRHILLKPKATSTEVVNTIERLDSISLAIKNDSLTFENAAQFLSQDKNSKLSGGAVINPNDGSYNFMVENLSATDYYNIKNLQPGQISEPFESVDEHGKQVFKIVKLKSRTQPHKANLTDDYQLLQSLALKNKEITVFENWVTEKQKTTYIKIDDTFKNCSFKRSGWIK